MAEIVHQQSAAMIDPLPEQQRAFLAVMGLADEFTVEMAQYITGDGPQALLQPLGYVNSIQVPFRFWHGSTLRCASTDFFAYNGFDLYVIIPVLAVSVNIIRIFLPFLAVKLQKERLYPAC